MLYQWLMCISLVSHRPHQTSSSQVSTVHHPCGQQCSKYGVSPRNSKSNNFFRRANTFSAFCSLSVSRISRIDNGTMHATLPRRGDGLHRRRGPLRVKVRTTRAEHIQSALLWSGHRAVARASRSTADGDGFRALRRNSSAVRAGPKKGASPGTSLAPVRADPAVGAKIQTRSRWQAP
jgi:hypothetical protein